MFVDITPALFVLLTVASAPRLAALSACAAWSIPCPTCPTSARFATNRDGRKQALIAARILNYDEIVATLPANSERQLIDQIVSRLTVGAPDRTLYQGDGGIFAWFEEPRAPFGNHLDALYALFRNPARVAGMPLDLIVAFGVEVGSSRSLANRLASALVAAEEAAHDGLKWKYHDPESLEDASWKLSMLSQLDGAIDAARCGSPTSPSSSSRRGGSSAPRRWPAGPTRKRARSPRPSSSPPPSSTTGSAS